MINNKFSIDLTSYIKSDKERLEILKIVKSIECGNDLWIAGGFVRNLVWDIKHNYKVKTDLGDIDIFYFDERVLSKAEETILETKLHGVLPNINWSVKNQARMHIHNNDLPYSNLSDALARFPETASAVAVKLNSEGSIDILAPLGLNDLFNLIVRPTSLGGANPQTLNNFRNRYIKKEWKRRWPNLIIKDPVYSYLYH